MEIAARPDRAFTYADLEEIPDDGYRREIIGGALILNPSPVARHQLASFRMASILDRAAPPDVIVLPAPLDWRLPDGGSVVPDLVVVARSDIDLDGPLPPTAVPLLVVEVLSPSSAGYDRLLKRDLYERFAVPAYWIVDPMGPSLLALRLVNAGYKTEAEVAGKEALRTDWPFRVEVRLLELTR